MPYWFPRSSIKFQGHTGQNITDFKPNWAFPDYRPVAAFKSLWFALFPKCFEMGYYCRSNEPLRNTFRVSLKLIDVFKHNFTCLDITSNKGNFTRLKWNDRCIHMFTWQRMSCFLSNLNSTILAIKLIGEYIFYGIYLVYLSFLLLLSSFNARSIESHPGSLFYQHGFDLVPTKMWDVITYLFPNVNNFLYSWNWGTGKYIRLNLCWDQL